MIGRPAAVAVLVALAAVAGSRAPDVARAELVLDAHGERTWMAWSHYRADADRRLDRVAAGLPDAPDAACLSIEVAADQPAWWWHAKALYHLERHRVVEVRRAGEPPAAGAACLVLEQGPDGAFGIAGRPRG